ncbi:hypothetical protein HMPREF7215_0172 [Pyramidobacter piscolens W5455]|uniref:Ribosomal protein S18 n=1 Tax=Pyramidobacter piscolens W5455 TaxID=352165 RepID=A0ABM9ZR72_9BACT|nr:hypothetical protein HMPREF7215_0172 [Pyramidobacter piscolens W5455]
MPLRKKPYSKKSYTVFSSERIQPENFFLKYPRKRSDALGRRKRGDFLRGCIKNMNIFLILKIFLP